MKLTTITAKNLKGRKFSHKLEALNIIAGPNDMGKTAAADAIKLALMGHLPGHPKSNAGIFALSSGAAMMVEATLEDGRKVKRAWKSAGKSVKLEEEGVEDLPETPLALMDASEYFAKSDRGRAEMAFSLLDLSKSEITPASVTKAAEVFIPVADDLAKNAFANIIGHSAGKPIQEWLEKAIELAAAELAAAKKEVSRYAATAQGIAALGVTEDTVDPAAIAKKIAEARGELAKLKSAESAINRSLEEAQQRADAIRERHRKAEEYRAQIGTSAKVNATVEDLSAALAEAQTKLGSLEEKARAITKAIEAAQEAQAQLQAMDSMVATWKTQMDNLPALQQRVAELEAETAKKPDPEITSQAQSRALGTRTEIVARRGGLERELAELERQSAALEAHDACPTCGTQGKEFKERVAGMFAGQIAEKRQAMEKLDRDYQVADSTLAMAKNNHNAALEAKGKYDKALEALMGARMSLTDARNAAANVERSAAERARLERLAIVPETQNGEAIAHAKRTVESLTAQLAIARAVENLAALGELEAIPDLEAMGNEAYRMECEIGEKENAIEALEGQEKQAQSQLADVKRLQQAADERQSAETRVEALANVQKTLLSNRETLVNTALEPLLKTANTFTAGILDTPLELREGEIGRQVGQAWVPVRCFGGTYTAITYAAIQAALGTKAPARLVIVDEMGRMDAINKAKFLRNIRAALDAGLLDQFVGIDVAPEYYTHLDVSEIGLRLIEVKG